MISVVLGVVIVGCGSLRKPAVVKTFPNNSQTEKDTNPASTDSVVNLLSTLDKPLILANGIEISVHVLAGMNVKDIRDFSVYTGADAIKIYGTRGTEGVINIKVI